MTFIFHTQAVAQTKALLFQRAGNPQLALMFGDQATGQNAGLKEWVDITNRKYLVAVIRAENRHLFIA